MTSTRRASRLWAAALATVPLILGAALIGASPAQAADLAMTITPSTGSNQVSPTFVLSNGCPAGSTSYAALMFGGSFPADGQLIGNPGNVGLSGLPFSFQASISFQDAASDAGFATLSGTYTAKVICQDDLSNVLRTFGAPVTFSSPTTYSTPAGASPTPTPTSSSPSPTPTASVSPSPTTTASPSPSESTEATVSITDTDGVQLGADPALTPGQAVTILADGFEPDEDVTATLHSAPTTLAPTTADADGVITYAFTVPDDLAVGAHTLVLAGANQSVTVAFSVVAADSTTGEDGLAATGSSSPPWAGIALGLGLVVAGWFGVVTARRHGLLRFGGDGPRP